MSDLLFSVSGLRGIVGAALTPEVLVRHAAAFGRLVGPGPIVIGRDTRPSGDMVQAAVTAALTAVGCDVIDVGIVPTPTIQLVTERSDAVGGLCVTASHNPAPWNALKFVGGDGLFLDADRIARLADLVRDGGVQWVDAAHVGRLHARSDAARTHIDAILAVPAVDAGAVRAWAPRVVLDAVNGAGGALTPQLLEALGCRAELIHCALTGAFPRGAEPLPENLGDLCARVRESGADLGLAHDPDADRLALVAPGGDPLGEETTLVLAVDAILSRTRGPVVTNLSTTRAVDDVAARYGVPVHRTPVGEANVVSGMKAHGAIIGGEGNGGVIDPALHYGRDAPHAIALILSRLAHTTRDVRAALAGVPRYVMVKKKLAVRGAFDRAGIAGALAGARPGGRVIDTDGIRYDVDGAWVHVRPSGTEPVVRVIAEAADQRTVDALVQIAESALGVTAARA